jgi:hypothetical protein
MPVDEALRRELLTMEAEDRRLRQVLRDAGELHADPPAYHPRMRELHQRSNARLWEILDDYETWPGRRLVGDDGAAAAWLIAQHALLDPELQRRCLEMLEIAVDCGDAEPAHYAYLLDRVRMADGRDQVYGTQFVDSDDGRTVAAWPIEDRAGVDERRAKVGLPPVAEHTRLMQEHYEKERTP